MHSYIYHRLISAPTKFQTNTRSNNKIQWGRGGEGAILSTKCMGNMNYAMCCTQKTNKAHHLHLPLDPCVRVIIRVSVAFGAERQRNIE